jgi:polysaccharide export outer membrane protein
MFRVLGSLELTGAELLTPSFLDHSICSEGKAMRRMFTGFLGAMMLVALMSPFWFAGCSHGKEYKVAEAETGSAGDYKIAPSDVLEITIYGEEGLTRNQLVVRPDGKVSFPLVGDVEVGGLTTAQVKDIVEEKVRTYIPEAVAAVSVMQLGSLQYYVVGKVAKPGMYNVSKPLTVMQALALAGGMVTFAKEDKISILRNHGNETVRLPFNYEEIKKGKNLEQNILLERGDVVVVP